MTKTRIVSLVLVLALLASVFSVLPVAAEESSSEKVDILAQNVVYGERVQIAYAVNVAVEDAADVTVEYYLEGAPETTYKANLVDTSNPNNIYTDDNGSHPVFATFGFHATHFTDVVYATAYTGDAAPADATYKRYSVAEYFYTMLYREGFISKTYDEETGTTEEKLDSDRRNLYLAMMNYGRYAQEVLINNKNEGTENDVVLITDYCFLWSDDADLTINGHVSGFYKPGVDVVFACSNATTFKLTAVDGTYKEGSVNYTTEAGKAYKVTAEDKVVEDTVTVTEYESSLPYSDYVKTYDSNDALVENTSWPASNPSTSYASLDVDPKNAANHMLHVRTTAGGTNLTTKVLLSNTNQVGNCYTFETKMYAYAFASGTTYANIQFINSAGAASLDINIKALSVTDVANNCLAIYPTGSNYGSGTADSTIFFDANKAIVKASAWFTIRLEYYYAGGDSVSGTAATNAAREGSFLKIYVNDALVYEGNEYWQVTKDIKYAQINHEASGVAKNVAFDDISFTQTDKTYVATQE